ncbi:MAG: efflux RND transporter periplasmic adaptor subunit [Pseudomonadota bacterium]
MRFPALSILLVSCLPAWAALPFPTAKVVYQNVDKSYSTEATVEAVRQSTVSAQVSGRITAVNFDVGDTVKAGQVIVRIDPAELSQAVAGSRAQVAQAEAQLANAKANYERQVQLFQQKFISQAALDRATAEYRAAQAAAQAAIAGAGQTSTVRSYTTLTAPFSGVVMERHVEVGEMATPGKPLMTGFDPTDLRVVANIPQYMLAEIQKSAKASVEIPSLNKWIEAKGITVLPSADIATHTVKVRLDLPQDLGAGVIPGIYARAYFAIGAARKLVIPNSAVLRRSEITAVYVVDAKERVSLRQVRLGDLTPKGEVEVPAGLNPGEIIALDPVKAGIYLKSVKSKE